MKKKAILSIFIIFALSVCFSVYSAVVTTSCGTQLTTVDMEYFETYGDWEGYMEDLNEIECGTRSGEMGYAD